MSTPTLIILDSWKMSERNEIIASIEHSLEGLTPGLVLKSIENGLSWKIVSRTIFIQAENQKRFKGEKEIFQRFTFQSPIEENFKRFQKQIAENESRHIYQYSIQPIGHENKPKAGERLEVTFEIDCKR